MNEQQLMENGFRYLENFNAAVKLENGGFTVAIRLDEWIPGNGMTCGEWIKSDDFRLVRGIKTELYLELRDRFAGRLAEELPIAGDWEAFTQQSVEAQLLVIAEYFNESFLWDCQENPYLLEKLPQPQVLPTGDLDFTEVQDFLRARNRNQRKREFTAVIRNNRDEYEESTRILGELWGFEPDESYYGNPNSFEVEELEFKVNPQKATRTVVLRMGKAPSGYYSAGVSMCLERSGGGYAPHVWNPVGYVTRDNALLATIEIAREWLDKSDDNPRTIANARKWLEQQEAQVMQLSLF